LKTAQDKIPLPSWKSAKPAQSPKPKVQSANHAKLKPE